MHLTKLLRSQDLRLRLDLAAPTPPRLAPAPPLVAPPSSLDPALARAAAAHAVAFDLERRAGGAARRHSWTATRAPARLEEIAPELVDAAETLLEEAARDLDEYVREPTAPAPEVRARMAGHAIGLARLDATVLAGYVDERILEPERDDHVADVLAMLDATPWPVLLAAGGAVGSVALSPPWDDAAAAPGETLADFLVDGRLLLVKATKVARVEQEDVRALVLRLVLDDITRAQGSGARPPPREVGVLLARHGHLWTTPAAPIRGHAAYAAAVERVGAALARERKVRARAALPPEAAAEERPQGKPKWARNRASPGKHAPPAREGKAKEKKQKRPREGAPRRPSSSTAPSRPPPPKEAREAAEEGERRKPARPDWRKGSAWRRSRGL